MGGTNSKSTIDAKWKASDGSTTFGDADTIVATTSPPPDSNGDWGIIRCPNQEKNIVFPKEGLGEIISEAAPVYENEKPENITVIASARQNISVGDYCKSSNDASWIDSDSTYATKKGKITLNKFDRIPKWLPKSGNKCDPPGCHCLIDEKNPSLPGKDLCIVPVDRTKPGFSSCAEVCAGVTNLSSCANYNKDKTPKRCNVDRYPTVLPKKILISPSEGVVINKDTPGGKKRIAMILASLRDQAIKLPTLVVEKINDPAKTGRIFLIILVIGILITWYRRRNRITKAF